MRGKRHPCRRRQISTPEESSATDQNAKEVSTDQTIADWQSGLHKVTSSEYRGGPASYAAVPKGHDSIVIRSSDADAHFVEAAKKIGDRASVAKTKAAEALVTAIETAINDGEVILID